MREHSIQDGEHLITCWCHYEASSQQQTSAPLANAGEFDARAWLYANFTGWVGEPTSMEIAIAQRAHAAGRAVQRKPDALNIFLSQKCIWDEQKQDWVEPNGKTLKNLVNYVSRLLDFIPRAVSGAQR